MKRMILSLAVALHASQAIALDGNDLLKMCDQPESTPSRGLCNGFIMGASSGIELGSLKAGYAVGLPEDDWQAIRRYGELVSGYCEPERITNKQQIDIVIKFLNDNPENRHLPAAVSIALAFTEAFPCE